MAARSSQDFACWWQATSKPTGLNEHYVVAMMTSHIGGLSFPSDVVLQEWQKAGLPKPPHVRLAKVVTMDRVLVRRKLGRLRASDQKIVKNKFREFFSRLYDRRE